MKGRLKKVLGKRGAAELVQVLVIIAFVGALMIASLPGISTKVVGMSTKSADQMGKLADLKFISGQTGTDTQPTG